MSRKGYICFLGSRYMRGHIFYPIFMRPFRSAIATTNMTIVAQQHGCLES